MEHQAFKKRPAPVSTSPSSPISPKPPSADIEIKVIPQTQNNTKKNKSNKKVKNRSRSSSSTRSTIDIIDEQLEIASEIFLKNKDVFSDSSAFKYIIEHFPNKNINIQKLCKDAGTNAHILLWQKV